MKVLDTFEAKINIGAQEGYDGIIHTYDEAHKILRDHCDDVKLGITLTETEFIYVNGYEKGFIIGLINYPRFPLTSKEITQKAFDIAQVFIEKFNQERISIVCSDKTYMIEKSDNENFTRRIC